MKRFINSFRFAASGIVHAFRTQMNFRVQAAAAVAVITAGALLQISSVEWAIVIGCCGMVLALECINTAIERLADRITEEQDPLIQHAKDAAAGGVLLMSVASAAIGIIILAPKLVSLLFVER